MFAMSWPYHLLDLSDEEKHLRRERLDRYGVYAQLSSLIPILGYQLYSLGIWVYSERQKSQVAYSEIPSSPITKQARRSSSGTIKKKWRSTTWWLEEEVGKGWGLRSHWIAFGAWTSWLLFLCVHQTGEGMPSSPLTLVTNSCYHGLESIRSLALSFSSDFCLILSNTRFHSLAIEVSFICLPQKNQIFPRETAHVIVDM